jgi:hypothetical protein
MSEVIFPEACYLRCDRIFMAVLRIPELNGLTMHPQEELIGKSIEVVSYPSRWTVSVIMTSNEDKEKKGDWNLLFSLTLGESQEPIALKQMPVRHGISWMESEVARFLQILEVFEGVVARRCTLAFFLQYSLEDHRARMRVEARDLFWPLWGVLRWFGRDETASVCPMLYFADTIEVYYYIQADKPTRKGCSLSLELTFTYQNAFLGTPQSYMIGDFSVQSWRLFCNWATAMAMYFYRLDNEKAIPLSELGETSDLGITDLDSLEGMGELEATTE